MIAAQDKLALLTSVIIPHMREVNASAVAEGTMTPQQANREGEILLAIRDDYRAIVEQGR